MVADGDRLTCRRPPPSTWTSITRALAANCVTSPVSRAWVPGSSAPASAPRPGVALGAPARPSVGAADVLRAARAGVRVGATGAAGPVGERTGCGVGVRGSAVGGTGVDDAGGRGGVGELAALALRPAVALGATLGGALAN